MSQQPGLLGPLDDHWPPEPPAPPQPWAVVEGPFPRSVAWSVPRLWWLNLILFLCTAVTATVFGYALVASFAKGRPFNPDDLLNSFGLFIRGDLRWVHGVVFSVPLLLILLAHEMGHYLICVNRGVNATLPYFMPSPTLFGTLGAFIRIKTPIYTRRDLFDIGSAGPLAGFVTLLPFFFFGVWQSHLLHIQNHEAILIADPLGLRAIEWLRFGGAVSSAHILLHPTAIAALAGMLLTALNLLPLGQLDGGHILYAVFGERWHKIISTGMVAALVIMGKFYPPWWLWAIVMFFFGRRHPLVYDNHPLTPSRLWFAFAALLIFIVSYSLVPTAFSL